MRFQITITETRNWKKQFNIMQINMVHYSKHPKPSSVRII